MSEDRHSGTPGGGGNGFAYEYSESVESDTSTTSTSTAWETVHTHTVVTAGDYLVMWNFEISMDMTTSHIFSRVRHNATVIGNYGWEPEDVTPDPWDACAGFRKRTLAVDDTITLEYGKEGGTGVKGMRRCRVLLIAA